ncbi:hypothetical protein M885DRAFT_524777 [Pelagophyceae sp. CCMP2097]|nr:hypothetical protein M885DRAFT_524777 [Pelagophyceae sp. CCMP2097]
MRVAVVGGGIAGSMASLALRARGVEPLIFDLASGGGRLGGSSRGPRDSGAQFLRAKDERFRQVLSLLESQNVVQKWKGRFGILGSHRGGFLPKADIPPQMGGGEAKRKVLRDSGDFCGFLEGQGGELYVGTRDNSAVCKGILSMAALTEDHLRLGRRVRRVELCESAGWRVFSTPAHGQGEDSEYVDAVLIATHDPQMAADALQHIASRPLSPPIKERLADLESRLRRLRDDARTPVCTLSVRFEASLPNVPFDAAALPNSDYFQFIAREASKPGRLDLHQWTAISTSALSAEMASREAECQGPEDRTELLSAELVRLLAQFGEKPVLKFASTKTWSHAFSDGDVQGWSRSSEASVVLEPFRLGIAGDFIADACCPVEAAALSGLEAGQRIAHLLTQ